MSNPLNNLDNNRRNKYELQDSFISDIRNLLSVARKKAYTAVNAAMVEAYWHIGKRIVQEEQQGKDRADYGVYLIKELSIRLSDEFGRGFSISNLKDFRQFYLTFPDFEKSHTLCSQLTWSHLRLIMHPFARKLLKIKNKPWLVIPNAVGNLFYHFREAVPYFTSETLLEWSNSETACFTNLRDTL